MGPRAHAPKLCVLTYVRNAWGNAAPAVSAHDVEKLRTLERTVVLEASPLGQFDHFISAVPKRHALVDMAARCNA